jgi:hypothetical protein
MTFSFKSRRANSVELEKKVLSKIEFAPAKSESV